MHKVFISYAAQHNWEARQLAKDIEAQGADKFLDALEIFAGDNIDEKLFSALAECNELWVLLTPRMLSVGSCAPFTADLSKLDLKGLLPGALDRPYLWMEIGAARARGIPIIGLLKGMTADQLLSDRDVPPCLKTQRHVNLNRPDEYDQLLNELHERVQRAPAKV